MSKGMSWWAKVIVAAVAALCGGAIALRWLYTGEAPPPPPPPASVDGPVVPGSQPTPSATATPSPPRSGAIVPGG